MRISSARCALIVLPILALAGCKSSGSSWYRPSFSLSKLNPFSSSSEKSPNATRPSDVASPTPGMSSAAGYAAASSSTPGQTGYPDTTTSYNAPRVSYPNSYPNSQYPSAGPQTAANPATTPQSGYYGAGPGYEMAGSSRPAATRGDYSTAGATGPYGDAAGTSPRYGTVSDRYGVDRAERDPYDSTTGSQGAAADPYQSVRGYGAQQLENLQGSDPRYGGASSGYGATTPSPYERDAGSAGLPVADARYSAANSGYGRSPSGTTDYTAGGSNPADTATSSSHYDSGARYGPGSGSLVGDRYARPESASTDPACSDCRPSPLGDQRGAADWNPGDTGYEPARTGYEPGNTGYNPPGVSPYRSPANSYTAPFLPGSTRLYTPRSTNPSDAPAESPSPSSSPSRTDVHVVPAAHTPVPSPTSWLR